MSDAAPPRTLNYETYVTGLLAWLTNRLSTSASSVYRRMFGIGVMEWRVLAHLAIEPGATGARISRVIGLDKAAISRTMGVLINRGLAARSDGKARGQQLVLTQEGAALHAKVLEVALLREARLLAPLTKSEQAALRRLLIRLLAHVPPPDLAEGEDE